jgi:hypothetical protein
MAAGFIVAGFFYRDLLWAGGMLSLFVLPCYLLAPVSYDVSEGRLSVQLHAGRLSYGSVVACAPITDRLPFTLRLFGNGGLFAGEGIFWNQRYGVFRAYVTSARPQDAVMVQTQGYKVLITPEDPRSFIDSMRRLPEEPGR